MDFSNAIPNGNQSGGLAGFDAAEAAPEFTPLPPGIYTARVVQGEVSTTKAGADCYRMRFEVVEGPSTGRTIVRIWTFSPKALPYSKRDLAIFGLTTSEKLLSPFPPSGQTYIVRLVVALQRGNDGTERNDIKRVELIRIEEFPAARFLLRAGQGEGGPA